MLASQVFARREGASESENVPLMVVKVFSVYKQNQHLPKYPKIVLYVFILFLIGFFRFEWHEINVVF